MKRSLASFVVLSRRAVLLIGVILSIGVFGIISWKTTAGSREASSVISDRPISDSTIDLTVPRMSEADKVIKSSLLRDDPSLILLNSGPIDTKAIESKLSASKTPESFGGKEMRLVKFEGPIQNRWYSDLEKAGVEIVDYIPNYAYMVYGDDVSLNRVRVNASKESSPITWYGDYPWESRINPAVFSKGSQKEILTNKIDYYQVQLFKDDAANAATLNRIGAIQTAKSKKTNSYSHYVVTVVALTLDGVKEIAKQQDVISIYPYDEPVKLDERQDMIMAGNLTGSGPTVGNYLTYLAGKGFNTSIVSSFAINLSDSGVDNATTTPNHFGLYRIGDSSVVGNSRIIYNRLQGTANAGSTLQGCDGHGNLNCHIIGGYVPTGTVGGVNFGAAPHADASGFRYGLGIAPFVKIGSSVIFDPGTFTSPTYQNLESQAYRDGARISSNSWGSSANTYTTDSQQYDFLVRDAQPDAGCSLPNCISTVGNQEYIIAFAAGNGGAGANTVGSPGTGKNVITVGASENVQAFSGGDNCGVADVGADSANDIIGFSSRGPTSDGRKKPDIVGPGTHVSGGVAQATLVAPAGSGTGAQLACFDGTGVCGGLAPSNFFPAGQQYYTASSGTSHSTPAIAGEAALIRQYFINNALTPPSPAMTKALMMNTARYLNGTGANDTIPSNNQGMGEMNLNSFFDVFAIGHSLHDETAPDMFTATGQIRTITGNIADNTKPLRVTLAWTDAPGATSGNAFVNNLDLEVTVGGNTYKGNVFLGANSVAGGTADTRNNVESVFIPAGVSGAMVIKITATNIAGNGVPNNATPLDQDFALVGYNIIEAPLPVIATGATAITAESCLPASNAIDPGETVTVNFSLSNVGTANTSNLTATLQATGGVTSPSGPQNYGALIAGGASGTQPFTFTAGTSCGQTITATFQLQDGAANLGTVTFTFGTGSLGAPVTATYTTGNLTTALPDNTTVDVPINIPDSGVVGDINVKVRMNHTFDGDVSMSLVSPTGVVIPLATNRGGSGDNYGSGTNDCSGTHTVFDDSAATAISAGVAPFAGTFKPESPLTGMNGLSTAGTWLLRFSDNAAGDTGTIGCVQLEVNRLRYVCCGVAGTPAVAAGGPGVVTAENRLPPNSAPDPGETVTVMLPVVNNGTGPTTNLVGTLQNTGGVSGASAPQTYGALAPLTGEGPPVSRPFTFLASGVCGSNITLTLALQDGATNFGTVTYTMRLGTISTTSTTFSNPAPITINDAAAATPYPSIITVAGAPATVTNLTVTLTGLNHTFPDDVDMLLVGPTGQKFIMLSDTGGTNDWINTNITLDDNAAALLSDSGANPSGTYKPTNVGASDAFAGAPAAPYLNPAPGGTDTFASAFGGTNPNGNWSLYIIDDLGGDVGTVSGGWSLTLSSSSSVCSSATASGVEVSGRVLSPNGRGLRGARVIITDQNGVSRSVLTGAFGYYSFADVESGQSYVVSVKSRRYTYSPRVLQLTDNVADFDFTPDQ